MHLIYAGRLVSYAKRFCNLYSLELIPEIYYDGLIALKTHQPVIQKKH